MRVYMALRDTLYKFSANDSTSEECFNVKEWLAAPDIET